MPLFDVFSINDSLIVRWRDLFDAWNINSRFMFFFSFNSSRSKSGREPCPSDSVWYSRPRFSGSIATTVLSGQRCIPSVLFCGKTRHICLDTRQMGTEFQKVTRIDCANWNAGWFTDWSESRIESFGKWFFWVPISISIIRLNIFAVVLQARNEKPVSKSDAWDYAASIGAKYIETSSRTNVSILSWIESIRHSINVELSTYNSFLVAEKCQRGLRYCDLGRIEVFEFIAVATALEKAAVSDVNSSNL